MLLAISTLGAKSQSRVDQYICPPCDMSCDDLIFEEDGVCPHCGMSLIMKTEDSMVNMLRLRSGAGNFLVEGGKGKEEKPVKVFYYRPEKLSVSTRVLMLLPGAGRNAYSYRDTWIEYAEKHNLLVLALEYSLEHYPEFWNYNLAGMIKDVQLNKDRTDIQEYKIVTEPSLWLFGDFDRIFDLCRDELQLESESYDMFGHSAGGQLLHRLAIFQQDSKAERILAANSGWYTLVSEDKNFPLGLKLTDQGISMVNFSKELVVLLGQRDDANETRGELRHTSALDQQGLHRLARGKYFFRQSKKEAESLGLEFNWKLEIIPRVGHDYRRMSRAAASYLYD